MSERLQTTSRSPLIQADSPRFSCGALVWELARTVKDIAVSCFCKFDKNSGADCLKSICLDLCIISSSGGLGGGLGYAFGGNEWAIAGSLIGGFGGLYIAICTQPCCGRDEYCRSNSSSSHSVEGGHVF